MSKGHGVVAESTTKYISITELASPGQPDAPCVICERHVALNIATAGSLYADGQQAYACNVHLIDRAGWAVSWALFEAKQQMIRKKPVSKQNNNPTSPRMEVHPVNGKTKLSMSLAQHLPRRLVVGPAVVVTEHPNRLLCITRKHWINSIRDIERRRASTLDAEKQRTLTEEINRMHTHEFTAKDPKKVSHADVYFVAPEDLDNLPTEGATVYFATPATHTYVQRALRHLSPRGLVVAYEG